MSHAHLEKQKILDRVMQTLALEPSLRSLGSLKTSEWLPGDASNRFYARLHFDKTSQILMVMNAPEAFKSEEVTGAEKEVLKELPFVSIDRSFESAGVRVPHIHYVSKDSDFLILEDLGDELLYSRRQSEKALEWYERAIDELIKIQGIQGKITPHRFTRELLTWEFEHFVEYALEKRGKPLKPGILDEIRQLGGRLVSAMTSAKQVLVHRDFHSKNLLVRPSEKRVGVIDFQDALMGPVTYDLASLLRDSYVRLQDEEEEHLLKYYEAGSKEALDRKVYGMTSLQRNLKAVGRFYYISIVKGRDTHLPYVKPSLLRIFKTLRDLNELRVLSILGGLLKEEASKDL